ncbi:2-isopropylmalate synthase [Sedimentisphaera salicampi]|uniref:2-isopropylmalate synthase n=1 Tax=Sedimentisphaera salicampi TaxID=1941349 RepID=A0A1W6LK20_9BACT|nr:2-isopropylmalate synthase [Sedimentisphaera salicampi]ARN56105.1 2-isopropylmalate synthase [Sedimentisphaera salicampi]OXU15837.1 2-isopropylmalate synthase [Sedimentisphaera salicampi]
MKDKIYIFDTTLRDGEQAPGAAMGIQDKLQVAHQLEALKIDIIEAGFPVSSQAQFEATEMISRELNYPTIAGLARASKSDIDKAGEALKAANRKRIHTFIATSPIHMEYKLGKTPDEVLKMAVEAVSHAKTAADEVEFSPEDGCRSDMDFLVEIVQAVIEAGATTVNIPDTVGYVLPEEYGKIIATLRERVPNIDNAVLSTHCHNDLGMAAANSLAGVKNGARQVECTINGIGERAGNAAMEEIVLAVKTRSDFFEGIETDIKTTEIAKASKLVSRLTGFAVAPNKAIVGSNAFAHESGIHVHGILKNRETYEIMTPETIGLEGNRMVLGRHSGKAGFKKRCEEMGYKLSEDELKTAFDKFCQLADKKKEVFDEDIAAIISDDIRKEEQIFKLDHLQVASGSSSSTIPTASVRIIHEGKSLVAAAHGDGPVDAAYQAVRMATEISPELESYSIRAVTGGKDALGEATVEILDDSGKRIIGRGASTDIIEASAKAYVDAINRLVRRQKITEMKESSI